MCCLQQERNVRIVAGAMEKKGFSILITFEYILKWYWVYVWYIFDSHKNFIAIIPLQLPWSHDFYF